MKIVLPYRVFIQLFITVIFIFPAALVLAQEKNKVVKAKHPNIIYIYADDLGYGELGSYGQQKIKTPNLDRMAAEGMRFTQHYAGSPVCAPSRAILLTGKHSGHAYIRGNYELGGFEDSTERGQMPLPEGTFTIAKLLKKAGYTTGMVGKWGLGMTGTTGDPLLHGFDYYYGLLDQKQAHNFYPTHLWENARPTGSSQDSSMLWLSGRGKWDTLNNHVINVHKQIDSANATDADFEYYKGNDYAVTKMTQKALSFIERNKQKPFFLYLPYTLPHLSLQAPEEFIDQYKGKFNESPYYGQHGYAASKYPMSTYAAMISYLDAQVGTILQKIKQLGLDNNTILMFSSDNGATFNKSVDVNFFNSVGGLRGLKMDLYEGGIRVPFIARWPGIIPAGKISEHISVQYDLMSTLAELTNQTLPVITDGISFLTALKGSAASQKKHEYIYFEYPENGGQVAIRMGDWKGIRTNIKKDARSPWQLFNLKTDRNETTDVASKHPEIIKHFESIQKSAHQHPHIREWEFIDPAFN